MIYNECPADKTAPPLPMVRFILKGGKTDVFDCKAGGTPYMPKGFEYPCERSTEKPLRLLSQINFAKVPHIEGFPEKGILQFFISPDDDIYGADIDEYKNDDKYRIIFHEKIITDKGKIMSEEDFPKSGGGKKGNFPVMRECRLLPCKAELCPVSPCDFRFDPGDMDDDDISDLCGDRENTNTCIGGYPAFTQTDPREYISDIENKTVNLFQLDSDGEFVMWGDMGVGNFLISPEDLKARDFGKAIYNWDCC